MTDICFFQKNSIIKIFLEFKFEKKSVTGLRECNLSILNLFNHGETRMLLTKYEMRKSKNFSVFFKFIYNSFSFSDETDAAAI